MSSDTNAEEAAGSIANSSHSGDDSNNNNNGKREREDDNETAPATSTKLLRSSDESDEKASTNEEEEDDNEEEAAVATALAAAAEKVDVTSGNPGDNPNNEGEDEEEEDLFDDSVVVPSSSDAPMASEAVINESSVVDIAGHETVEGNPPTNNANPDGPVKPDDATPVDPVTVTATVPASASASTAVPLIASDPRVAAVAGTIAMPADNIAPATSHPIAAAVAPNVQASMPSSSNAEQQHQVEERGEVSAMYVGRVIGKGGEMIRDLQARSGARIDVDQNVPAGQPRVITYRGTRETVDFAKQLVQLLSTDGVHESSLPLGNASQEFLVIPAMAVGKVIGRGGEMIRELQARSQAKIQIDHSGNSGMPNDQKQVTLTGTHEAVVKAKEMVLLLVANPLMDAQQSLNLLIDDKMRNGTKWGSSPPYLNLPNQGVNMQPSMQPQAPFQGMPQPAYGMYHAPLAPQQQHAGGYPPGAMQQGHAYGGPPPQGGGPMTAGYAPTAFAPVYGSSGPNYGGDSREMDVIHAPRQFMGRVIGGKGVTVNDLQRRSGCDIQINQDVAAGQDCEITIKGSRQGIEQAKAMIQEIIEIGPQHPYAGGMDAGNFGGAGGAPMQSGGGGYHGAYAQPQYASYQQQPQQARGFEQHAYGQAPTYTQHGSSGGGEYGQPGPIAMGGGGPGGYGHPQQQPYGGGYSQQQAPPPRQPPPSALGWKLATAPDGKAYYYNERTGETQWDKPAGMP